VTRFPGLEPRAFDPRTVFVAFEGGKIYVSVPLRNVGRDVAVIDDRGVELTGPLIGASEFRAVQRHHVPVGETTRVDFIAEYLSRQASDLVRQGLTMRGIAWQLAVPYDDFAGAQRTVAELQIVCRGDDVSGPWQVERVEQRSPHIRPSPHALESSRQEEPGGDEPSERRPDAEPERRGVRGERVVDLWGNPVRPRRRRR
jgi:hypothetical protein